MKYTMERHTFGNSRDVPDPRLENPVESHVRSTSEKLGVMVSVPHDRQSDDPVVVSNQWSTYVGKMPDGSIGRFWTATQAETTAAITGRPVVVVNSPGVSPDEPNMTARERRGLARGDFTGVSVRRLAALKEVTDALGLPVNALSTHGLSQGAHTSAALAAHMDDGMRVNDMLIGEPANTLQETGLKYWLRLRHCGQDWDKKVAENPAWGEHTPDHDILRQEVLHRPAGLLYYLRAMQKTPVEELVAEAHRRGNVAEGAPVVVLNGGESKFCPDQGAERFARELGALGLRVTRLTVEDATHASQDNMGYYANMVRAVDRIIHHEQV